MSFVSYAQNFEDLMLWRALKHVTKGFYVDVGAQDPVIDSVSKAFYERGWRGFHVEPLPEFGDRLRADRPDETVVQAVIGATHGPVRFYEIPGTGLSTALPEIAEHHRDKGFRVRELVIPGMNLDELFAMIEAEEIHWLKIDVEGSEKAVISGWRDSPRRPWIVVVESTYPNERTDTHMAWHRGLVAKGYVAAYADGLNRFYVATNHRDLLEAFRYGPNVFDEFELTEHSWCVRGIRRRHGEEIAHLKQEIAQLDGQAREFKEALATSRHEASRRDEEISTKLTQAKDSGRAEVYDQLREQMKRNQRYEQELSEQKGAYTREISEALLRERISSELLRATLESSRKAAQRYLSEFVERARAGDEQRERLIESRAALERSASSDARRLTEMAANLESATAALALAQRDISEKERQLNERGYELREAVDRHLRERAAAEERFSAAICRLQDKCDALERQLSEQTSQLAAALAELATSKERAARSSKELDAMRRAISWRVTAPLRWLGAAMMARTWRARERGIEGNGLINKGLKPRSSKPQTGSALGPPET